MINLIQKLADCDEIFFSGWVLAKLELKLEAKASSYFNNLLINRKNMAVFEVCGFDEKNQIKEYLKTWLILPKKNIVKPDTMSNNDRIKSKHLIKQYFVKSDIDKYIALSGDKNIIHQKENPIVPGLCMLWQLQKDLCLTQINWKVVFEKPVFVDEEIEIAICKDKIEAYVNNQRVYYIEFH